MMAFMEICRLENCAIIGESSWRYLVQVAVICKCRRRMPYSGWNFTSSLCTRERWKAANHQ
jgi:hypothetical protein